MRFHKDGRSFFVDHSKLAILYNDSSVIFEPL